MRELTKKKFKYQPWMVLIPPIILVLIFFIYPMLSLMIQAFRGESGGYGISQFVEFFSTSTYTKVILNTLGISLKVTIICLLLGYPYAYYMATKSKRVKSLLTICLMIPFWTSILIRTYAWMILLQKTGVINKILLSAHIIKEPVALVYNEIGVLIGMTHVLLPYMVLSLEGIMEGIDSNLTLAANNLGANKFIAFWKVYFPLSMPGVSSGFILVFIMCIGFYVTPSLLGGTDQTMISQVITQQVGKMMNLEFASAIALILIVITMILLVVSKKVFKVEKLW